MGLFKRKIKTEELETEVEIEFTAEEMKSWEKQNESNISD